MTMTKDLISRQDAIDYLISKANRIGAYGYISTKEIYDYLSVLPPAQPEIIMCKDCRNWDTTWQNDWVKNYHYCPLVDGIRKGDWYCADAERRTDE